MSVAAAAAAAAAKTLQSCPTLCDPIDSSPPSSFIPGILQASTLEWGAIVLHFVKCFFCIWFLILHFLNTVYHIDWSADVEPSLHPWNKSHLIVDGIWSSWCIVEFSLLIFCSEFLLLCLSEILVCNFLFVCVFIWFWH